MNPNEISIEFYAGEKAFAVGKKDAWLDIVTDTQGLAALGKIEKCITTNRNDDLRLNGGWNNNEQGYARDQIIFLALSKFEIGAKSVTLTGEEIEAAIKTGLEKLTASQKQMAENKERQDQEQKQREERAAAKQKAIIDARELLKVEISEKEQEIAALKQSRDEYRKTAQDKEEAIRRKLIEDGTFDIEEEHTVTYKVVRDEN